MDIRVFGNYIRLLGGIFLAASILIYLISYSQKNGAEQQRNQLAAENLAQCNEGYCPREYRVKQSELKEQVVLLEGRQTYALYGGIAGSIILFIGFALVASSRESKVTNPT